MEDDEEDDIYAPDEGVFPQGKLAGNSGTNGKYQSQKEGAGSSNKGEDSCEDSEEDESDSDIDIITEKKEEPKKDTAQAHHVSALKAPAPITSPSSEPAPAQRASLGLKIEPSGKETPSPLGSSYPAIRTSSVDVDAKPIFEPSGKPITEVDMDSDFPEDDKPWRRPGTDMTDYFNYGFDEFTWANYCLKQQSLRKEVADSKKQLDEMQSFMTSGMPGMPGLSGSSGGGMAQMPGIGDVPPEMQQMFGQMMAQGMDPSSMDPNAFMQMMQGGQGGQGGFQNFGQQQNQQQMGYGYGGGGGGNQGGRGRGRRW